MTKARLAAGCLFQLGDGTNNIASTGNDVFTFPASITGGTFTLSYNGFVTASLTYSAVATTLASTIQTALNALPNVVSKGASFTAVGTGGGAGTTASSNLHATAAITAGSYTLTQGANTTPAIQYNATAAQVTTALGAATPAPIPFTATGGTFTTPTDYVLTANAVGVQAAITLTPTGITGGTLSVVQNSAGTAAGSPTVTATPGGILANYPIPAIVVNAAGLTPSPQTVTVVHTSGVAAGQAFTTIAELTALPFPAPKRSHKDVTSFDSPNLYREFIADYKDAGDIKIDANFINDVTQNYAIGLISKFEGGATYSFRILVNDYPNTAGTAIQVPGVMLSFSGFFTEVAIQGAKPEDVMTVMGTLKITGSVGYSVALP